MIAPAKPRRKKVRLTARQRSQVEKLYPMAIAIGRRCEHRNADALDRAHDFIIGASQAVRSYKPGKTTLKGWAKRIGVGVMQVRNGNYDLIRMPRERYLEADDDERRRNRTHGGLDFVGREGSRDDEDDEGPSAELRAALRRLGPGLAELVERCIVREQSIFEAAADLGMDGRQASERFKYAVSLLRNDRDLCRAMGERSFFDDVPTAPGCDVSIPNRDGMRRAAAFLRSRGGLLHAAVMARMVDTPVSIPDLAKLTAHDENTLRTRLTRLSLRGLVKRRVRDGRLLYSLTPRGRRLVSGVRFLTEFRANHAHLGDDGVEDAGIDLEST